MFFITVPILTNLFTKQAVQVFCLKNEEITSKLGHIPDTWLLLRLTGAAGTAGDGLAAFGSQAPSDLLQSLEVCRGQPSAGLQGLALLLPLVSFPPLLLLAFGGVSLPPEREHRFNTLSLKAQTDTPCQLTTCCLSSPFKTNCQY